MQISGYFYVLDSFFSLLTISVLQGTHLRSKLLRLRIRFLLANVLFSSLSIPQLYVLNQVPQGGEFPLQKMDPYLVVQHGAKQARKIQIGKFARKKFGGSKN